MRPKFIYQGSIANSIGAWILALLSDKTTEYFLEEYDKLCLLLGEIVFVLVAILVFLVFYIVPGLL